MVWSLSNMPIQKVIIKNNLNNKIFFFYKMTCVIILSETNREFTFADDFSDDTCVTKIKVIQKNMRMEINIMIFLIHMMFLTNRVTPIL